MSLRQAVLDAQEENLELRKKVQELQMAAELEKELTFDGEVYWRTRDGKKEGPFARNVGTPNRCLCIYTGTVADGGATHALCILAQVTGVHLWSDF